MKTKWTPGRWYYRPEEPRVEAEYENSAGWFVTVADCGASNNIPSETMQSNALLISLAPEMAEALREELEALRVWRTGNDLPQDVRAGIHISVDKIERLLARLEGGEK